MALSDLENKYHVKINGQGFIIAHNQSGRLLYEKKPAPSFVNKTGSGDSAYRDSTFWQFWAQINWRNGAKQERFDDAGKFWKSENVDVTQNERITLSRKLVSAGQLASGAVITAQLSWRAVATSSFGDGTNSSLTISANTTDTPIDSACTGSQGSSSLSATNVSFAAGQKILIIQSTGTGAGNYQENSIAGYTAGTITLDDPLNATYGTGAQVLVMKQYTTVTIDSGKTLTAKSWNGTVGGVLAFYANDTVTVTGNISANSVAFAGGAHENPPAYQGTSYMGAGGRSNAANYGAGGGGDGVDGAGGGGAGHASTGTTGSVRGGGVGGVGGGSYGVANLATMYFGSGGGGGINVTSGEGGPGGGIIFIVGKTITVTGSITSNGGNGEAGPSGGGGGSGGSILLKAQTATLGSSLITSSAGSGGTGSDGYSHGGGGSVGRIAVYHSGTISGTTTPTASDTVDPTLSSTPVGTSFTEYAGASNGKIYQWDGSTTWTELFDVNRLTWYETGADTDKIVGDTGGVETAQSQGFKVATAQKCKAVEVYLKKNAGTPGDITVRIETDSTGKPSGTLVDAAATTTIPAFTDTSYAWKEALFATAFSLSAATLYHVVLKTTAASNDNNYAWDSDASSPTYTDGAMSVSTDGGSTWSAVAAADAYFRVKSSPVGVLCGLISSIGGTQKMYWGAGSITNQVNGDARLYSSSDASTFVLSKTFTDGTSSGVTAICEFEEALYAATCPQAYVMTSTDASAWTQSTQIRVPQNPGFIYCMTEYNQRLYVGGGSPEMMPDSKYNGFVYYFDTISWKSLYPFDHTVVTAMGFYDAFMFIGTYHGQVYIFDTSSIDPLLNFKDDYAWQVSVTAFHFFDDKMYILLKPQESTDDTNGGLWLFERHGVSQINGIPDGYGVTYFNHAVNASNTMMIGADNGYVFKIDPGSYEASGELQTSYHDAILPSIDKLYNEVKVQFDPLPANTSITLYYKFEEDDDWTSLGSESTLGATTHTFSFATGVYSKKISLRYVLATSASGSSPVIRESIMKYTILNTRKWMWNLRLMAKGVNSKDKMILMDKTQDSRTGVTIRGQIESAQNTQSLIQFYDIEGTLYTVLFNTLDENSWVFQNTTTDVSEGTVAVTLIEA